jgi:hypothetical protein
MLYALLMREDGLKTYIYKLYKSFLIKKRDSINKTEIEKEDIKKRLDSLGKIFSLNEIEKEIIIFIYLLSIDSITDRVYNELAESMGFKCFGVSEIKRKPNILSILTRQPLIELSKVFNEDSPVIKFEILDEDNRLAPEIYDYLEGNSNSPITKKYFTEFTGNIISLENHLINRSDIITVTNIISHKKPNVGINILLYGEAGTGKTEFAKFVARKTNRRLIIKRASDLLSCWIGETEKNIREAFIEAQKEKAILFIDEADSFLGCREYATHSWEISGVNEMLGNMETFRGILICATNFKKVVDNAAIRRFNIKLEFDYLTREGIIKFYNLFFKDINQTPLSNCQMERLYNLRCIAPGDFKIVYQKFILFDKNEITHYRLIESLNSELIAKDDKIGRPIGFSKAASVAVVTSGA